MATNVSTVIIDFNWSNSEQIMIDYRRKIQDQMIYQQKQQTFNLRLHYDGQLCLARNTTRSTLSGKEPNACKSLALSLDNAISTTNVDV